MAHLVAGRLLGTQYIGGARFLNYFGDNWEISRKNENGIDILVCLLMVGRQSKRTHDANIFGRG